MTAEVVAAATVIGAATTPRPVTPVGLLAASLERLVARLDSGPADDDFRAELRAAAGLAVGFEPYLERCTSPESAALQHIAARTAAEDWAGRSGSQLEQEMLSGHVEGQLLRFLVAASRATRILEIGMFSGYSALAMAEALPAGGRLVACEIDGRAAAIAREGFARSAAGDRIEVRLAPALDTLQELAAAAEMFDLVFLDADKAGYAGYLEAVLGTGLLAPGGVIAVDNTLLQGEPWTGAVTPNGRAIADFNEALARDPRVEQVLLPLRDGITLIRRVGIDA